MNTTTGPIIVGFDGSDDAVRALRWAIDLAERTHDPIRVVVAALDPLIVSPPLRDYEEEVASSAVALAHDLVKDGHGIHGDVVLERGATVPVLLAQAEGARAVVVGSRGHGSIETHWLGSVSQHIAGHAHCPVVVVRPAHNPRSTQILVGIDGSPASVRALEYACDRAVLTGESVLAAHSYRFPGVSPAGGLAVLPENLDMTVVDAAEKLATDVVAGVTAGRPDVSVRATAVVGRPGRVLSRLSDDASLVVVGSRGRSPFEELLLGSVAQETLHRAACPVAVIR